MYAVIGTGEKHNLCTVPVVPALPRAAAAVNWIVLGMSLGAVAPVIKPLHSTDDGHL